MGPDRWLDVQTWVVARLPSNLRAWLFGLATASLALLVMLWEIDGVLAQLHIPRDPSHGMSALHESGVERGWDQYVDRVHLSIDPGELGNVYLALDVALVLVYTSLLALVAAALARAIGGDEERPSAHRVSLAGALLLTPVLALVDLFEDVCQFLALDDDKSVWLVAPLAFLKWALLGAVVVPCLLAIVYLAVGRGEAARDYTARDYTRTLAVLRFQLVAVGGMALLLLGPLTGEQSLDAILRWESDWSDGVVAIVLTALLGGVILVTALLSVQAEERDKRIQIGPLALTLIGAGLVAVGAGFLIADEGGAGLCVLGGLLVGLALLSKVIDIATDQQKPEHRGGTLLIPRLLGLAPLLLLGLAVLRATTGQLALYGFGGPDAWWVWMIVALVLELAVVVAFALMPARNGLWGAILALAAAGIAIAIMIAVYVNPWSAGALVGAVGAAVTFLMVLVVLGLGVTWLEHKYQPPAALVLANFHRLPVILLLLVATLGGALLDDVGDHPVRTLNPTIGLDDPPVMTDVLHRWKEVDLAGSKREAVPLVFVAATGGGIRAAYWTARVLRCGIEGEGSPCPAHEDHDPPPQPVFAASGASGGSLGLVTYLAHLNHPEPKGAQDPDWVRKHLDDDYLAPTLSWMLFSDLPKSVMALHAGKDRGEVLERAWEQSWGTRTGLPETGPDSDGALGEGLRATWTKHRETPLVVLNGTSVHDNCRVSTSVLDADVDAPPSGPTDRRPSTVDCQSQSSFERLRPPVEVSRRRTWALPATHDTVDYLDCKPPKDADLRLSTAALLSARFPVISPSGRVEDCGDGEPIHVVDGGYLDNSGAWTVVDLWRRIRGQVWEHNSQPGTCIVPVFLQIDNDYAEEDRAPQRRRPLESFVPLKVFTHIRRGNETNARQEAALIFDLPRFGTVPRAEVSGRTVRRYAHVYPRAQPGTKAPLGWLLSDSAMNGLDEQLANNEKAFETIRDWFDADLSCDR